MGRMLASWVSRAVDLADQERTAKTLRLVDVLTSPDWFGLETATPLQRAICHWAEGVPAPSLDFAPPDGEYDDDIMRRCTPGWVLGGGPEPTTKPREVYILAGIRCGKSLIAAAQAVYAAMTVDTSVLRPGERARVSVVSLKMDLAKAVIDHLNGAAERSPYIRTAMAGKTRADGIDIVSPISGHTVEIMVRAGARAGASTIARWAAGVIYDEAARMQGEEEAVINFDDARTSVLGRLLPGAQLWAISSPWAPLGPIYDTVQECHGSPGRKLVIRAPGPAMFPQGPYGWTPARCDEVRQDANAYRMDVLGEWGTAESGLFTEPELVGVTRMTEIEMGPLKGEHCIAAMDTATERNAWTLGIACIRRDTGLPTLLHACQWVPGGEPLDPAEVLDEIATIIGRYGVDRVYTDQYGGAFVVSMARDRGVHVVVEPWTAPIKRASYESFVSKVRTRSLQLSNVPQLVDDLKRAKWRLTAGGKTVVLPQTADGRHCDYAPMLAQLFNTPMQQPDELPREETGPEAAERRYVEELERKMKGEDRSVFSSQNQRVFG